MKQEFWFLSKDGVNLLHALKWIPDGEVRAVLQIIHGMAEHIERYDEFAQFLSERGVLVVGHSHLGHGRSAQSEGDLGWFGEPDGNACLIGDIHQLRLDTQNQIPEAPYYLLGHSMGSFLTRQYLGIHADGLSGAIVMGTSEMPVPLVKSAKALCVAMAQVKGWRYRSPLIDGLIIRGFERKLGAGWLSKNEESTRAYAEDPLCGFAFTLNGYFHLFSGIDRLNRREHRGMIPKNIPLLFTAGAEDPVGTNGEGVKTVYNRYLSLGANASMKLYPGDRHEILNELDRATVYNDLYNWMNLSNKE